MFADADVEADAKETMEEKEEEWKPVADGATDGDEPEATPTPSADGDDEPVPLDIPPMPGQLQRSGNVCLCSQKSTFDPTVILSVEMLCMLFCSRCALLLSNPSSRIQSFIQGPPPSKTLVNLVFCTMFSITKHTIRGMHGV